MHLLEANGYFNKNTVQNTLQKNINNKRNKYIIQNVKCLLKCNGNDSSL